jgi:hypothetical protein
MSVRVRACPTALTRVDACRRVSTLAHLKRYEKSYEVADVLPRKIIANTRVQLALTRVDARVNVRRHVSVRVQLR